jgi:HTH-type transcriptional regulator/antitoxin HigA
VLGGGADVAGIMLDVIELSELTRGRLLELYARFPPLAIQTDAHLDAAQEVVNGLLGRERDEAEELYLDLMGTLIYAYEEAHVEIPALPGLELISPASAR